MFGDDPTDEPAESERTEAPIAGWLVDQLREALAARGLTTMAERQQVIEAASGRSVESLRSLTRSEALRLLEQLQKDSGARAQSGSSWDARDEDTWIDRL